MSQLIPYIGFNGNCAEAMRFYEGVLGGKLEVLMRGGDSPMAEQIPVEARDRIIHAALALKDGGYLYAGDAPAHIPYTGIHGVSITISYDTVAEAEAVFARLADGGRVTMAMQPSFWAKKFGMLVDRFGLPWIINGN